MTTEAPDNNAPSPMFIKKMEWFVGNTFGEEVAWLLWESGHDTPTEEQIFDALITLREGL